MSYLKWFLEHREDLKSKRLRTLIGDILRALANYVPLFKLSPAPINAVAETFNVSDFNDMFKMKLLCKFTPFHILFFDGMKKNR